MKQTTWKTYEEVARYLLDRYSIEFGLMRVEEKQKIPGLNTGTEWEIDAKGITEDDGGFVIVECRKYTNSKQNQEKLGGLAFRITDTGAVGGIIVSPLGLQEGAQKVAKSNHIISVQLDANCSPEEFKLKFLDRFIIKSNDSGIGKEESRLTIRED
jgi:hypothetical protein